MEHIIITRANFGEEVRSRGLNTKTLFRKVHYYGNHPYYMDELYVYSMEDDDFNKLLLCENFNVEWGTANEITSDFKGKEKEVIFIAAHSLLVPVQPVNIFLDEDDQPTYDEEYFSFTDYAIDRFGLGQLKNVTPLAYDIAALNDMDFVDFLSIYL